MRPVAKKHRNHAKMAGEMSPRPTPAEKTLSPLKNPG